MKSKSGPLSGWLKANWLVISLLVSGAVWATTMEKDIEGLVAQRIITSEQVRGIQSDVIQIKTDVAFLRGLAEKRAE